MTRTKHAQSSKRAEAKSGTKQATSEVKGRLWFISTKIRGVGEMMKQQDPSSLFSAEGAYGIGSILTGLADDLDEITDQ